MKEDEENLKPDSFRFKRWGIKTQPDLKFPCILCGHEVRTRGCLCCLGMAQDYSAGLLNRAHRLNPPPGMTVGEAITATNMLLEEMGLRASGEPVVVEDHQASGPVKEGGDLPTGSRPPYKPSPSEQLFEERVYPAPEVPFALKRTQGTTFFFTGGTYYPLYLHPLPPRTRWTRLKAVLRSVWTFLKEKLHG